MLVRISKVTVPSIIAIISAIVQLALILLNLFEPIDAINYAMYINNYIFGGAIILSLCLKGMAKHLLAIIFFGCYMLFLMAQKPFEPHYNVFLTFSRVQLDTSQYFSFSVIIFMGLCVAYYSYIYFSSNGRFYGKKKYVGSINYDNLKPILSIMLAITFPCALYMQGYIVLVRGRMAYTSGYLINVNVPSLIKVGYYLYSTVVLLYLALKPKKNQMYFILITYLIIEGGLQIFQGRRALFASTLLFIIWYLVKYYEITKFNFKLLFRGVVIFIALIVLLIVVEQTRNNATGRFSLKLISRFLISTGGSDSVIANTIYRADSFPASGLAYLIDPIINNPIINTILGKSSSAQGMTYLQQHNSFSHWISYMTESSLYLSGHGMGSSYLAEVWLAFGNIGVFFVSIVVGWAINRLNSIQFDGNVFRSAFIFLMVQNLFTLPRDGMFSWVNSLLYMVFTFIIIYPFYQRYCKPVSRLRGRG